MAEPALAADSNPHRAESTPKALILVVDDREDVRRLVGSILERDGYETQAFASGEACLQAMSLVLPNAIYLDLEMPGMGGLATLERIRGRHPTVPVIMLTADESVESVVAAMKLGAYDYLLKPPSLQKLVTVAKNAVDHYRMSLEITSLTREANEASGYGGIVARSESMKEVFRAMDQVAASAITVLIHGESGTGKELVARAIHARGPRGSGPFVALNCAAIPETLQESELFGHEKGAFTGALGRRLGKFELANHGTLFLDEVGELSLPLQAKLLRVLQDGTFQRVGGSSEIRSDFRLIAATHKHLTREVREGRFRDDLYFRIVVFELELPPLRDREGDVDLLTDHFLRIHRGENGASHEISPETRALLRSYPWPGNVRELENVIQRALVSASVSKCLGPPHLPQRVRDGRPETPCSPEGPLPSDAGASSRGDSPPLNLEEVEAIAIRNALEKAGDNLAEVSRLIGVSRATLYRKLKKYRLR